MKIKEPGGENTHC